MEKTSKSQGLCAGSLSNQKYLFMEDVLQKFESQTDLTIQLLEEELKGIRTGRANTGMVENMTIQTYGGSTTLKLRELATITTEGPVTLVITAFDPATVKDIEKAILTSPMGINPQTEGTKIFLRIPPMSEEQRKKYVKLVSQLIEDSKNTIRHERDEARKVIKRMFDEKSISEDDKYRTEKEIDSLTTIHGTKLQELKEKKEKEIMEV